MKPADRIKQLQEIAKQRRETQPKPPRAYIAQIMSAPRQDRPDRIKELPEDVRNTVSAHIYALEGRAESIAKQIAKLDKLEDRRQQLKLVNPSIVEEVKNAMSRIFKERKNLP